MKQILILLITGMALLVASCTQPEAQTGMVMPAPENIRCTVNADNALTFEWDEVQGAEQYTVRLVTAEDEGLVELQYETVASSTFEGLEAGVSYVCKVRAMAGMEYSQFASSEPVVAEGTSDPGTDPGTDPDPDPVEGAYEAMLIPAAEDVHKETLAFPGAEGGGMYTTGGRGGSVLHVTTLADSGEGSLRWAVSQSGPRTIVFDVAGIIHLQSRLDIKNGDLTIAGQTAPGDGICIADNTVRIAEQADNIIIRFLRFRLGDEGNGLDDGSDAFWGRYCSNIIIDHCSMSWSIDEVASFYANKNFTMQWCTVAEALRFSGKHSKEEHGYGGIWGGRNASFHHNLLANNDSRNARIDHPQIYGVYLGSHRGNVDYRNNVIYNWGNNSTYGGEDGQFNIVGNYYKPGPASTERKYFVDAYWYHEMDDGSSTDSYPELYMEGNYHAGSDPGTINEDNYAGINYHDQRKDSGKDNPEGRKIYDPLPIMADDSKVCYTTTHQADAAFSVVTRYAGASLVRDDVDERIAREAENGTVTYPEGTTLESAALGSTSSGGMIDSQSIVGGWPTYSDATENEANDKTDSDGDGIPDWFETMFGQDGNLAPDGKTIDIQGRYTDLEMYLHYLVRNIVAGQTEGGTYTTLD